MELRGAEAGGLSPLDDRLWETRVSSWNKLRVKEFISGREGKKTLWIIEAAGKFMWAVFRAYGFPERLNLN